MRPGAFISKKTRYWQCPEGILLESGDHLKPVTVAYRTWGTLNTQGTNGVLVCHALTGSADVDDWWGPLLGPRRCLDPEVDFVIAANVLGSCYGTTGPMSLNPQSGKPFGIDFPAISIRDMVRLQEGLLTHLGVENLRLVIGGSMGGMQVLEWAAMYPDRVEAIVPIAISACHSPWCIALHEAQRQAVRSDPQWQNGHYGPETFPKNGLAAARMMAICSYRSWQSFHQRFGRETQPETDLFTIENYLRYQGSKLVQRFDANSYLVLTQAMDRYDLSRDDRSYHQVLSSLDHPTLLVSIDSDVLYPPVEQRELATLLPQSEFTVLSSTHGHDGFLIEMKELNQQVLHFRSRLNKKAA